MPYSLRNLAAQRVRDLRGVEFAASLLGHAKTDTTEIYSNASLERAIEAVDEGLRH